MPDFVVSKNRVIDGISYPENRTITAPMKNGFDEQVPPAVSGTLAVRTDADTGTLTMTAGHGITTGSKVDLRWTEAGVLKRRRGMTVGTVATNSVPIDGGTGDNLPVITTAIIVGKVITLDLADIDIDVVNAFLLFAQRSGTIVLLDDSDAEAYAFLPDVDGKTFDWDEDSGDANPIDAATIIAKARISHFDTTATRAMRFQYIYGG